MRVLCICASVVFIGLLSNSPTHAGIISTEFNTSDGFTTGGFTDVTLTSGGFQTTFSGGQQQQSFDGPSYNVGPAAYMFINGSFTGSFGNTVSGDNVNDDKGLIDFNIGVTEVSFFAANRGNGSAVRLNIFGLDDLSLLGTIDVTQSTNQSSAGALKTVLTSSNLGGLIGSIGVDLPGPAGNPPYVLAIDTFSASPVPEPSSIALLGMGAFSLFGYGWRRKRNLAA